MRFSIFVYIVALTLVRAHSGRIINGSDAHPDDTFTFRVLSIENAETVLANVTTGVAISEYFGLVTAQCVEGFQQWYIGFGSINTEEHLIQRIDSSNIQIHPGYNSKTLIHNIAVMKFTTTLVNCIHLQLTSARPIFPVLQIFGFGYTEHFNALTNTLQYKPVNIISVCSPVYPDFDKKNSFCALFPLQNALSDGDQGGPVTDENRNILYGILSYWGNHVDDPAVVIDVAAYKVFIELAIESLS